MSSKECTACTTNTQINKTSDTLDMKGDAQALRSHEVDDLVKVGGPQTVVTTLPTEVGSLGSANHIHVQLFDGQVIQITSAQPEETEAQRKECEANMKQSESPIVTGDLGSSEGTVTLLTSNGKTYILPQPLSSAEDGRYIISNEVLSTEGVLHDDDLPQEKQILTISPPPPPSQSALNFSSSVASHLDALAIATSEVFSEDYESVPLQTQNSLVEQSNTYRFKNPNIKSSQEMNDKIYTHAREDYPRSSVLPDARIITITASDSRGSEARVEQRSCFTDKGALKKNNTSILPQKKKTTDLSVPKCKAREVKNCSEVGQIQLDSTSCSPTCSKWVGVQDSMSKELKAITAAPKVSAVKERAGEAKMLDVVCTKAVTEEREMDKTNMQITDSENVQDGSLKFEVQDMKKLRRSSRIRKVKKIANKEESDVAEGAGTCKKRKELKWEPSSALWECGSCDAMFRTRVSRDRHRQEGHAFTCYVCGWEGYSKTKYEAHVSSVHCNQQARCLACRKDFPSYDSYKQHMEETHSTTPATPTSTSTVTSMATTTTTTTATPTSPVGASADIKMEVESEARLEDEVEKEESQGRLSTEEKQNSINTNLKDFHSYGERSCPYCSKTFRRRSRFLRHLNYHQGKRTYMCRICTKCFVEKSGLRAHLLTHCPINKECPHCGKLFKTERTMTRHLRTHLNLTYTCEICNKQFRHEESLRVHKSVHKEGGSGNICTVCEKDCKTPHYLQLHMTTKHEAPKFTCQQCDRSFKWKQSFRKHMATHHDDSCLKFKCSLCPRHFMTSSELRLHQVVHSTEKKHLCDICGKAFKHEYTRDKHTKTVHREDREHMCPQCGALFKAKAYLDQHLAHVHTTKERVVCRYCGRDFKTEANLRSHVKVVHKPQNPKYTCKTCHKTFLAPKDLLRHSKVHTGIKDYMCPKCHRCFSRKDNMTAHLRTHITSPNSPDSPAEPDIVVPGVVMSQNSCHAGGTSELPHVISLTSSDASNLPSASTSNIALPTVSTSSANIVLSKICPANSIVVLSGEPPSETSPTSSDITSVSGTSVTGCRVSLTNLPVSSMADIPNMPSSSTGSIILSTVPVSSICNAIVSTPSTSKIVSSETQSDRLAHCTPSNLSHSNTSPSECSLNAISSSTSSSIINLRPSNSVPASETHTDHQTYNLHPHLVVSSAHHGSNIPTLLTASPVPSTILSLPPSHSTSSPVLVSQNNHTQMVCSTFQGEQVVLTAGPLTPISKVSIHDGSPPQYTQLDPLSTSISSTPATSMNVTISPLNHSASSAARNLNVTLGTDVPLSTDSASHASSVEGIVPGSTEPGTILPSSSILQEAALILPEKSGLYTIVGEEGKITSMETLTLHPVPPPPSHSD